MIDNFRLTELTEPLQAWYNENARILPWRQDPTPYHVWISEIMLQQTRVEAVKPYYKRFMDRLPDVEALAECTEDEYLKLWEGLGYYSRVRNLHQAAMQIRDQYHGEIPGEFHELLKLKGIGRYTAGAISSMAFGKPVAAVDGNVLRVLTRVTGDDHDIMQQSFRNHMEEVLTLHMQTDARVRPEIFNQALMELGATVCLPNGAPDCKQCPWSELCIARKENRISQLPVKKKAKARRIEPRTVLLLCEGDRIVIRKRPEKGLLAGLYELPNQLKHLTESEALDYCRGIGLSPLRIQRIEDAKHIFSHVEWHMIGYRIQVEGMDFLTEEQTDLMQKERLMLAGREETEKKYAIPSAFSAYTKYYKML